MERYNVFAKKYDVSKNINQIQVKQGEIILTYIKEIPEEPNEEQIEMVK